MISHKEHCDESLPLYVYRTLVANLDNDIQTAATIVATVLRPHHHTSRKNRGTYFAGSSLKRTKRFSTLTGNTQMSVTFVSITSLFSTCIHCIMHLLALWDLTTWTRYSGKHKMRWVLRLSFPPLIHPERWSKTRKLHIADFSRFPPLVYSCCIFPEEVCMICPEFEEPPTNTTLFTAPTCGCGQI